MECILCCQLGRTQVRGCANCQLQGGMTAGPARDWAVCLPRLTGAAALQARSDRLRWRTANARAERHSRVLSRHWQTYAGLCWQDVLVMGLFVAGTVCAGALVRPVRKPPEPAG